MAKRRRGLNDLEKTAEAKDQALVLQQVYPDHTIVILGVYQSTTGAHKAMEDWILLNSYLLDGQQKFPDGLHIGITGEGGSAIPGMRCVAFMAWTTDFAPRLQLFDETP